MLKMHQLLEMSTAFLEDKEMEELVENLAVDDTENAADLKGYQTHLKKMRLVKLEQRRKETLKKKLAARVDRKEKQRKKKLLGRARFFKKKGRVASSAGPSCAPPLVGGASAPVAPAEVAAFGTPPLVPGDEVEAVATRMPKEGGVGEWQSIAVPGGWIRWSSKLGKCDGHCRCHGGSPECKMDRLLKNGVVALLCVWLKKGMDDAVNDRDAHVLEKEVCSGEAMFDSRSDMRGALTKRAETDEKMKMLLDAEAGWRDGSRIEPRSIKCASSLSHVS